jgi:hypothetical protein
MTRIAVPALIVRLLRCAVLSELGAVASLIGQASMELEKEKHPELFEEPVVHLDAYRALLDVIAWGEPPEEHALEIDLDAHRWALVTALEARLEIERDYLRVSPRIKRAEKHKQAERNISEIEVFLTTSELAGCQ